MKRFLSLAALALTMSVATATAQNEPERGIEFPPRVVTNSFWSNWFVGAGGGVNVYFGDNDQHRSFSNRLAPNFNLYVGKWFTPGLGLRVGYSGLSWKGAREGMGEFATGKHHGQWYNQKGNFGHGHVDVMFNIIEMVSRHNPSRRYNIIPYAGAGLIHSWTYPGHDELALNLGIINRFRVTDRLAINVELSTVGFKDNFDGEWSGSRADVLGSLTAGVSYRIGQNGFNRNVIKFTGVAQKDYDELNQRTNTLREEVAKLQAENDRLKATPAPAPVKEVVKESTATMAPVLVVFDLGKSTLTKQQRVNLKFAAESMKSIPGKVFTLEGYADNSTGTAEINERLSRERISAVMDCLVNEFGVKRDQLKAEVKGAVDNMFYNDPALSRAVIIK